MNPQETKTLNSTKYFGIFQLFVLVFGSLSPHSSTQFSDVNIFHKKKFHSMLLWGSWATNQWTYYEYLTTRYSSEEKVETKNRARRRVIIGSAYSFTFSARYGDSPSCLISSMYIPDSIPRILSFCLNPSPLRCEQNGQRNRQEEGNKISGNRRWTKWDICACEGAIFSSSIN